MTNDHLFFFEQTDFSLRFARCVISETSLHIEELKEVLTADPAAIPQLAPPGTQAVAALRPKPRALHLATIDEAKRYPGLAGLQQFSQLPAFAKVEPAWFAGVQASDGAIPTSAQWLMSLNSAPAQQQARTIFDTIKVKPARCLDATLATVGAFVSTASGTTLLLEIGELSSHAFLIGPDGIIAYRPVSLNLDQIADAVQGELNLKFRGSAAKLFFNPDCDFTDSGPKIAARVGATLKTDLAPLLAGQAAPTALACSGLPALQGWLETQLASVLGLAPLVPDLKGWSSAVGVTFDTPALASSVSPSWFNFLHFINSQTLESPVAVAWQAEWISVKAQIAARPPTTPPVALGAQRPAGKPATNPPVSAASAPAAAKPATPAPAQPATAAGKGGPATPTPAKPAPAATAAKPGTPAATPAKPAAAQQKTPTPAAATPAKAAQTPAAAAAKPAAATSSVAYSKPSSSPGSSAGQTKSESKSKMPMFIGIGVLVLALAGGGFFYAQSQKEEATRVAVEKQKAEERAKAEAERAKLAEQKAQEEAANRKRLELESAQKLAQAENARRQAEEEARNQAATRLANARGTLVVTTDPAGATVTVGDQQPKTSPATFSYIKIGKYPVTITMAHRETVNLELEVTENNTTESGVIPLANTAGSIAFTSEPTGSNFEIRPAAAFLVTSASKRTGVTPATIGELDPGDYIVTYTRPGWAAHTETVTVARDATTKSAWTFPSGSVKISSSPAGATVTQDGVKVGVTPLTLRQPPGAVKYELKLAFHDPATVSGTIEEGKTLDLTAQLPTTDIIFGPNDLDKIPEPIAPKTPDLPASLTLVDGKVVIQMTIGRDGVPTDLKLVRASNAEIGKIYMAAVAKWKFKPGLKDGKPVRSSVVIPFLINASKD